MWDESHSACEVFCNFKTLKKKKEMHAGLRIPFIGNSHLCQGAFPRESAEMHFLGCLGKTETVWRVTARSK